MCIDFLCLRGQHKCIYCQSNAEQQHEPAAEVEGCGGHIFAVAFLDLGDDAVIGNQIGDWRNYSVDGNDFMENQAASFGQIIF